MLTDEELLALEARSELAASLSRRFKLQEEAEFRAVHSACIRLHNTGAWDLITFLESGALQALEGVKFFVAVQFLDRIIPELETDPSRLMAVSEALVERGGQDLAAALPNAAFREWCVRHPARAQQIIDDARSGNALASRNLTFPLEALQLINEARRFLQSKDEGHWRSAITALGRIPDADPSSRAATIAAFAGLEDRCDDGLKASLLHATAFILSQHTGVVGAAEFDLIVSLTERPGVHTVHAAAHVLWTLPGARRAGVAQRLLQAAGNLKPANKGTVNELDHALRVLLEEGQVDTALDFVGGLFTGRGELELTELDGFMQTLVNGPTSVLSRAVVGWLLSGEGRLCEAISLSLRRQHDEAPALDVEDNVRGLSDVEQLFVCRKAIGFFFIRPRTAASILVSVLRVCNNATAEEVLRHLIDPLLINYGGVRDYLKSLSVDDSARSRVALALKKNDEYLAGLRSVSEIKELNPSEVQRRVQHLRLADQSRKVAKEARKQSVFYDLVKRSVILHGRRSLSLVADLGGNQRRMVTDLHTHSVSFELPRMEIADPVGLDYILRVFRTERLLK